LEPKTKPLNYLLALAAPAAAAQFGGVALKVGLAEKGIKTNWTEILIGMREGRQLSTFLSLLGRS
jgi:hypothetical protein